MFLALQASCETFQAQADAVNAPEPSLRNKAHLEDIIQIQKRAPVSPPCKDLSRAFQRAEEEILPLEHADTTMASSRPRQEHHDPTRDQGQ